jgi:hypothetical protein
MKRGFFNIISLNDAHIPFHDFLAVDVAIKFCAIIQPQIIILHEFHDFYDLSKFDKNPSRKTNLQDEIDEVTKYLGAIRKYCPKSRIILLKSNHTDRLKKYLWKKAPELESLRALEFKELLKLDEYKIEYMNDFSYQDFLFKHGDIIRQESAMTAKYELKKEGVSGCSGHTHRLGVHYKTLRGGSYVWVEAGCLCKLDAEYIEGTADWQQGVAMVSFKPNSKHFIAQVYPIIDYQILYGNNIIK